ncbi:MAG: putative transporter [Alphaproteobacteria bacterium]|nr:putative transporter [Alphaproteobacteria bacterium]
MFQSFFLNRKWFLWSIIGSIFLISSTWGKVQIDVIINKWFGSFYNLLQKALTKPNSVTINEYFEQIMIFVKYAGIYVIVVIVVEFFTRHYVFRWRQAMNEYYTKNWFKLRHIEGAAQRLQEDTMRFARIVETLGIEFIRSILTLLAFIPLLFELGKNITKYPFFGEVTNGLVYLAIISALVGTVFLAIIGIKLPMLEFHNQRVEAAFRKELVYGEDNESRAEALKLSQLFSDVRKNYFKLYFHYLYFDLAKWSYLQFSAMIPYIALAPTVIAGTITFGIMQQIVRAFSRVEASFQLLVYSWSTIIELMSIYKRLKSFENQMK